MEELLNDDENSGELHAEPKRLKLPAFTVFDPAVKEQMSDRG